MLSMWRRGSGVVKMKTEMKGAIGDLIEQIDTNLQDLEKEKDAIDAEIRKLRIDRMHLVEREWNEHLEK